MTAFTIFGQAGAAAAVTVDNSPYTMGMQFTVSQTVTLTGIWFNSATGALELPEATAVYLMTGAGTGTVVSGTQDSAPAWSGLAGSGWVKNTYNGAVSLTSGNTYKVVILGGTGGANWYSHTANYWDTGAGSGGLTSGPITAPNNAGGDQGQDTFHQNTVQAYPDTSFAASNYWVDVELTTAGSSLTRTAALAVTPTFTATLSKISSLTTTAALAPAPHFFARLVNLSNKSFPSGFYPFNAFNNARFKPFH